MGLDLVDLDLMDLDHMDLDLMDLDMDAIKCDMCGRPLTQVYDASFYRRGMAATRSSQQAPP